MAKRYKGFKPKKESKSPSGTRRPLFGRYVLERLRELLSEESFVLVSGYAEMSPAKLFSVCMANACLRMGDQFRGAFPADVLSKEEYLCMSEVAQRRADPSLSMELDRLFYMPDRKKMFDQLGPIFSVLHTNEGKSHASS